MPDPEPAAVTRFKEAHSARGGGGRVVILPDSVHTAALAAEALGCEVGAIANSLLFDAEGTPVLILTSGRAPGRHHRDRRARRRTRAEAGDARVRPRSTPAR